MPLPDQVLNDPNAADCGADTWENFGRQFFQTYCLRCHSETLTTDLERTDAPAGINFNELEVMREFASRIRLRAGQLGDMPPTLLPGPRPSEDERLRLIQWIDCGTPSETDEMDETP
jgi:uncharacterized membrane protein